MKKENDDLTNLFRTRLEKAEMPVREGFWEELQQDIPAVISRRRQIARRFSAAASVLLILAGASAAFWYFSPKEEIADAFTQVAVSTGTSGKMGTDIVHGGLPDLHASSASPIPAASKPVTVAEEHEEEEEEFFSVSFSMSFSISSTSNAESPNHTTNGYDGQTTYAGGLDHERTTVQEAEGTESATPSVDHKKHRKWSLSAFASSNLLNDRAHSQQVEPFLSHTATGAPEQGTIKHKQSFSLGLTARKELSNCWGIESGLVYTRLNSELTTGKSGSFTQDQTLHYVGIPVKADLNLYKSKRVNLYASVGGMAEKCISGRVKTNYYENGVKTSSERTSRKADPIQLSLTTAIGLQYKLSDRLSLYAEPGLSYHFDDGSPVSTIRKEKPLNMNLLCGVRMTY